MKTAEMIEMKAVVQSQWFVHEIEKEKLTRNGEPRNVLKSPGQVEQPEKYHAHYAPDDRAGRTIGDGVHTDGPGQDMAAHDEDEKDQLRKGEQLISEPGTAQWREKNMADISEGSHMRISMAKDPNHIAGIGRESTQTENEDDRRNHTDCRQDRRQRKNAQRDGLCNHQHTTLPPGEALEVDVWSVDGGFSRISFFIWRNIRRTSLGGSG